jgi:hypothetical protein
VEAERARFDVPPELRLTVNVHAKTLSLFVTPTFENRGNLPDSWRLLMFRAGHQKRPYNGSRMAEICRITLYRLSYRHVIRDQLARDSSLF